LIKFPSLIPQASEASLRSSSTAGAGDQANNNDSDTSTLRDVHGDDQASATDDILQEYVETSLQVLDIEAPNTKEDLKKFHSVSTLSRSPGMKSIVQHSRPIPTTASGSPQSRGRKVKPKASKSSLRTRYQARVDDIEDASRNDIAPNEPKGNFVLRLK
jgi:hypothetical protein